MKHAYHLDTTVSPNDDFFAYVNNHWLKNNPIPDSETKWGTFYELRELAWSNTHALVEKLKKTGPSTHGEQLIVNFFLAGETRDEHQGLSRKSLEGLLAQIDKLSKKEELGALLGHLHKLDITAFWNLYVDLDDKDSSVQVLRLVQGGLSLPDRDYYLENSQRMKEVRSKYVHFADQFDARFDLASKEDFKTCQGIEKSLAEWSWTAAACRDSVKSYNKVTMTDLCTNYPSINWQDYFTGLGLQNTNHLVVNQLDFFAKLEDLFMEASLNDIKSYLKWHTLLAYAGKLNGQLSELFFSFFGTVLTGAKVQKPLWKRLIIMADSAIGEELGRLYVSEHFPESSKQQVLDMVEDIRDVYARRIKALDWMEANSKDKALTKLANMKVLIGYPNEWRDYSKLQLSPNNFVGNAIAAASHESEFHLSKVGNKPPVEEWHMTPQTVNAYHDPNRLEIVFPAAILQYPFFDPDSHPAENLAGIGYVIGHELTHGFDDQGGLFDEKGELNPWLSDSEKSAFAAAAEIIKEEANQFEVVPGVTMIGDLVIGEAIADLGGAEFAWQALTEKLASGEISPKNKAGIPAEELFFYGLATVERGHDRDESAIEQAKTDPHPDSRFRVNGVVTHMDSFYDIFNAKKGDSLYKDPADRARIW